MTYRTESPETRLAVLLDLANRCATAIPQATAAGCLGLEEALRKATITIAERINLTVLDLKHSQ